MKKKKAVAYVSSSNGMVVGSSSVIKWGDIVNVNGHDIDVSKAVTLGLAHKIEMAEMLLKDLKGDGLFIAFPIAMLMSKLQEQIGTGEELLTLVKA